MQLKLQPSSHLKLQVGIGPNIVKFTDFFQHTSPPDDPKRRDESTSSHPVSLLVHNFNYRLASGSEGNVADYASVSMSVDMNSISRPKRSRLGKKTKNEFDLENQRYSDVDFSKIDGFAEIFPEDKHLIVQLLQNKGFIVGMTGDGANVHSLKPIPAFFDANPNVGSKHGPNPKPPSNLPHSDFFSHPYIFIVIIRMHLP